jgi:hypothetical protein
MDPRVAVSQSILREQFSLAQKIVSLMAQTSNKRYARYNAQLAQLLDAVEDVDAAPTPAVFEAVRAIDLKLHGAH